MHIATLPWPALASPTISAACAVAAKVAAKPAATDIAATTTCLPTNLFIALLTWLEGERAPKKATACAVLLVWVATQAKKIGPIVPRRRAGRPPDRTRPP